MKRSRLPELDGIRGCAILLVLVWHYVGCVPAAAPIDKYIHRAVSLTWSGVDLFFVLSGFLIAGILLDNREADNYFRVFYARRVFRIFPLYYLLIGVFAAIALAGLNSDPRLSDLIGEPLPLWSYATFTQNLLMGLYGRWGGRALSVTWSLAVEEQFYLLIPVLVRFLPRRAFAASALLAILSAPLLRARFGDVGAFVWTPWRADSLLTGAILALAVRDATVLAVLRRNVSLLYVAFAGLLGGAAILTLNPEAFGAADHTWLAALYAVFLLLPLVDSEGPAARLLRKQALVWLGVTSYGIYLFHQTVNGLVHSFLGNGAPTVETIKGCALTVLSLGLTLGIAATSYRWLESPLLARGHRFKYRDHAAVSPIAAFRELEAPPKVGA